MRRLACLYRRSYLIYLCRLVATVIAWGAKFSEHPLLIKDRERNNGQSLLARALINRTRDLAEDLKVHRVPTADHVVVALLIEPMQNRKSHWHFFLRATHEAGTSENPDEPGGKCATPTTRF